MATLWCFTDPIDRLHQWAWQRDRARHTSTGTPRHKRQQLTRRAVAKIRETVEAWGYRVTETAHKCAFDLWIEGVRVEVKASTFNPHKSGCGRYQGHIKNHEADLVIFDCINGTDHFHVIPMADVAPRTHLAVYTYDPAASSGMWQPYLEQWDYLHQAIETSEHIWQPPLF